jgi:uncharacterized protein (TIGR03435 family)
MVSCLASILLFGLLASAQAPPTQTAPSTADGTLRFEVATIKPHDPKSAKLIGVQLFPGGRVEIIGVSFRTLVETALRVPYWEISRGEAWTEKDLYDLEAVPPEDLRASISNLKYTWYGIEDERLRQMLTTLLVDRFQLRFHRETKTGTVYLLQRGKRTFRLAASERAKRAENGETIDRGIGTIGAAGNWGIYDTSMSQLAKFASDVILHAPVFDETHLEGYFDYRSPTEVDMSNIESTDAAFPSFISEMGLRLKKSQGPVETIVIDHAEKPSEN